MGYPYGLPTRLMYQIKFELKTNSVAAAKFLFTLVLNVLIKIRFSVLQIIYKVWALATRWI